MAGASGPIGVREDLTVSKPSTSDIAVTLSDGSKLRMGEIPDVDFERLYEAQSDLKSMLTDGHVSPNSVQVAFLSAVNAELMKRGTVIHFGESLSEE